MHDSDHRGWLRRTLMTRGALASVISVAIAIGCSTAYITPDNRKFTTGGIFADEYWNEWTGGKNVRIDGVFHGVDTTVLDGEERLIARLTVPHGLNPVNVYAGRDFATQLYELQSGDQVTVFGETLVINTRSREDRGLTGRSLAIELHRIEKKE